MAQIKNLIAKWGAAWPSPMIISRQYDNGQYRIDLFNYPEPEHIVDEQTEQMEVLSYYLIVWMKETEDGEPREMSPIMLPGPYWIVPNYYTQLVQDIKFQFCVQSDSTDYEAHSAIFTGRIVDSIEHDGTAIDVIPVEMFDAYKAYIQEIAMAAGAVVIDPNLDTAGAAADAKAAGDAIKAGKPFVVQVPGSAAVYSGSITAGDFAKALAAYTAGSGVYAVKDGEVYQLSAASSSTMTFTQMYHGTMNFIKQIQITSADTFTVTNTALSSSAADTSYSNTASGLAATNVQDAIDESAAALSNTNERLDALGDGVPTEVREAIYNLFGMIPAYTGDPSASRTVLASWKAVITSITLNVSTASISGSNTTQLVATTAPAGSAVTWSSSDTSVATVSSSGLVTGVGNGSCTITASSGDKTARCTVTVTGFATLVSISAVYTQSGSVYESTALNDLKSDLVVTGTYNDSTTATITDYTLSGTLSVGTSTITVSYGGKSTTFNVTVSSAPLVPSAYQQVEYIKATGTQHIITDLATNNGPGTTGVDDIITQYSADIDFAFDEWQSAYATNIAFSCGSSGGGWIGYVNSKTAIGMGTNTGNYFTSGTVTERYQYHWSWSGTTATFKRNDNAEISRSNSESSTVTRRFALFTADSQTASSSNYHFNGKVYRATVYRSGEKVLDLVPCFRKSDNEIGVYDTVGDTFYTNSGTGTFEKGGNV